LVLNPGLPEEQTFVLPVGTVTVGRTRDNHIFCTHKSLSRRHAQLDYDGKRLRIADLQSKNGVFHNGRRVPVCEVKPGETFRCGDITILVESGTTRPRTAVVGLQTLPSPLLVDPDASQRNTRGALPRVAVPAEDEQHKERLFLLIRAAELLALPMPTEALLDELVVLAVQVLEVDRIALLQIERPSGSLKPRIVKTFVGVTPRPYSQRVVDWIARHVTPTSFDDVSRDDVLPGDPRPDANIKGAMGTPLMVGGTSMGVLYADSVTVAGGYGPDELALFRAIGHIASAALQIEALGSSRASGR